jgi:hypothetical protein
MHVRIALRIRQRSQRGVDRVGDFNRAQRDHLRAGDYADFLSPGRAGQPGAEILPRRWNRQGFHAGA